MERINALKKLDDKTFGKLANLRKDWLNSGDDRLINNNYRINNLASKNITNKIVLKVDSVIEENEVLKTVVLESLRADTLPPYRGGQSIALTIVINDKYYTSSYTLSGNTEEASNGKYYVWVRKDDDDIVSNHLFNDLKRGEQILVSSPFGDFYYDALRDEKNVIAIVSSDGVLPVLAMCEELVHSNFKNNMTIFYSEKKSKDLIYKDMLLEYGKHDKINVNLLLSDEDIEGTIKGFASSELIKKVYVEGHTSFFIAGSEGLLKYLDNELKYFKLPKKLVRYKAFLPRCNIRRIVKYKLTINIDDNKYEIPCYNNKTIMNSIFEAGIYIPSKCQDGSCGLCLSELVLGNVKVVNDKRENALKKYNYIHPCTTYPLSDIEIIVR